MTCIVQASWNMQNNNRNVDHNNYRNQIIIEINSFCASISSTSLLYSVLSSSTMAEIAASALLQVVFQKLADVTLKQVVRSQGIHSDLKNMERTLSQIQDLLNDASQKEITDGAVKRWLKSLQHLAYDIDDVLDDLATEAIDLEFTEQSGSITSKVRKLIPTCCTNLSLSNRMHGKLDNITTKLQDLEKEKDSLGLIVKDERSKNINRRLETSMVHASSIFGRQADKEDLVHKLLQLGDETCNQNFSIVPIVGMGGVGKTTLARLLYNEKQVQDHFQIKAWVCVSDEFDSFSISKVIFQSVNGEKKEFEDLNLLQEALRNQLTGKRFLLVLDDVWSDNPKDWETLVGPFHACAPGSKIIMTTRKEQLLKMLGYDHLNQLQRLSEDDALSLVALHALGVNNFDSHPSLKPHGEGIVKKCAGLPLALIALGRLLRTKKDEEEHWKGVLNSEVWRLQDGGVIVPALRLSYHDLSAHLKQLFAYCSLFPKDFVFDKEELVLLWIAEGFLHRPTSNHSTKEQFGHECFEELLSRSFFQHAPDDGSLFVMHDLMNDLATSVAEGFFVRLDNEMGKDVKKETLEKYRHMSFVRERYEAYKKFEAFKRAKSLRTFLATSVGAVESWQRFYLSNKILVELLPELPLLRVLCLSNYEITEVPESIGSLKHLRYLNLSRTAITHLPESVCNLYNLQTLIAFGCVYLTKLPKSFLKLKNLRHFDVRDTPLLNKMPWGIGELKSLQTLSKIIIGGENGFEITELKGLKNLHGKISIEGLDKVQNGRDAREANFSEKRFSELEMEWSDVLGGSRKEMLEKEVLSELRPGNECLEQLKIRSYGGLEFPNWVVDPLFFRLKHVSIRDCTKCTSLPPLGQLPALKELFVGGLDGVKGMGLELLGTGDAFPSLEILSFKQMRGWEKWSTNSGDVFPCLQELHIDDCPHLAEVSLETLPSLKVLEVRRCGDGVLRRLVHVASSVTVLEIESISGLNDVVWKSVIEYLGSVEELSIWHCDEIRYLWESEAMASKALVNLRKLKVLVCDKLESLGEKEEEEDNCRSNLLTSLRILDVWNCRSMVRCSCPDNIETLSIGFCTSITSISFPSGGGQKLKSVDIRYCYNLLEKELGVGQRINDRSSSMPMLESLSILRWPNLKSIIELNNFVHLTKLEIKDCKSLESFPDHELPNLTSLKYLSIRDCPSMDASFPRGLWPPKLSTLSIGRLKKPISEWGQQNFPTSLVDLTLIGEDDVTSGSQLSNLLPSSLTELDIHKFQKLESVSEGLQHLTSLQHLGIFGCPKMKNLPETLLPSLLGLGIDECPNLKKRCSRRGSCWPLISHVPCIEIDYQLQN